MDKVLWIVNRRGIRLYGYVWRSAPSQSSYRTHLQKRLIGMSKFRIFLALFLALMVVSSSLSIYMQFTYDSVGEACTSVIITGAASEGGYAILTKNRDVNTRDTAQSPVYTPASLGMYASVMVNSYWMGMNEKGLALMNTMISELAFGGSGLGNGALNRWIVQHCITVDEVCYELNNTGGPIGPGKRVGGTCIGVVDRLGKGAFIEVSGTGAYARFVVDGFDSEANHPRYYPNHASGPSGRDQYALDIMNRIYEEKGKISYRDVVQKVVRYVNDKEEGSLPFSVTGEIPNDSTQSSFVAVSGNPAYDGKLNCFWGEYGNNPIVGLFVPSIVLAGTPPPQTQNLYNIVWNKRTYARNGGTYYLPERVRRIQSYAFPAEEYTFAKYESLVSSIPEGLNDSELSSMLSSYIIDSVNYAVTAYSEVISDGFESGHFGTWSGTSMSSGETISIVNTRSHHGRYSARFASNGGGGIEYAYCYKTTEPYSELYSRGYFYVSQSGIVDENDRFFFIILKAGTNNVAYAGWRKIGGVVKWVVTMRHGTGYVDTYSTASPSLNRWYSVELHWKGDAGNGLGELYINGAKVIFVTGKNTAAYGDVNQVCFGLPEIYRCIGTTAYCDCAKIGTMYIGSEPTINSFTASPNPFSPNGDGTKDTTTIKASFNVVVNWNLQIRSSLGTVLRTWTGTGNSLAIIWNGKTSAGFKVPDGSYTVRLSGADLLGVTCPTTSVTAYVDTKLPTVTGVSVFPASFNPRIGQTTRINYALSESCYVTIKIYNNVGTLKRTLLNNVLQTSGLHSVVWNGKDGSGIIVSPGTYTIRIYVLDKAGNKATPYPITKTVTVT